MNSALLAGVSGLQACQKMLDVAGNNLANVNTNSFKSSRVVFSDVLGETLREASAPTATSGGTNPVQTGAGVRVAGVDRNMQQGTIVDTGQPLDMAIDGNGYFVLNDGRESVYTRVGSFAVDSQNYLVDPSTGFRVQRTGSEGVADGFQSGTSTDIQSPYGKALPAQATSSVTLAGNLSGDAVEETTAVLTGGTQYKAGGVVASGATLLKDLDGVATLTAGDKINITGSAADGTAVNVSYTLADPTIATVGDLLAAINGAFTGSTATMSNGELTLTDNAAGYSQTDISLSYTGAGSFTMPPYFKMTSVGGEANKNVDIGVYDSQGTLHTASASFVKTKTPNEWDLVLTSVTGDVANIVDRRIKGLTFLTNGAFGGIGGASPDKSSLTITFGNEPTTPREVQFKLGTVGESDGLSQFGGGFTVAPNGQDGYAAGWLSDVSVNQNGVLTGVFTNGVRRDLAALQIATFQNPAGLSSTGNNYFTTSTNSGDPTISKAQAGSAGSLRGGALEKSNVEMAIEFVNLIEAQSGFQANATTIRTTSEMLQQLSNLIR